LRIFRVLFPTLTAGLLINLSLNTTSVLGGWGIAFGVFYTIAAIIEAWTQYGRSA